MTTKTFDVLQLLVENAGRIVTKDEILGSVWNGNFVEESNLPVHISKIRRALGETAEERYIETVHGSGYRFISPVREVVDPELENLNLVARKAVSGVSSQDQTAKHLIAVLPIQNDSGSEANEYVVDGITDALIDGLCHVEGLRIIARSTTIRYKGKRVDPREVHDELGVSTVLIGRASRLDDRLVADLELIDAYERTRLWGIRADRPFSDIIEVQREIVGAVSKVLLSRILRERMESVPGSTETGDSYKYFLMGKYLRQKGTVSEIFKALKYFQKSLRNCPANIGAQVAIVDCYHHLYVLDQISRAETLHHTLPIIKAISKSEQQLDIIPLMLGILKLNIDWNADAAETLFRAGLLLNPSSSVAHARLAELTALFGRTNEALYHTTHLLALDPVSITSCKRLGRIFYRLGQYENAVAHLMDAREMEAMDFETLLLLGSAYTELGEYSDAREVLMESFRIQPTIETLSMMGYNEALAGNKDRATQCIRQIESETEARIAQPLHLAKVWFALENRQVGYEMLERAFQERSLEMYALEFDPRWKNVRSESRFRSLIDRIREAPPSLDHSTQ